jgi:hypothetical protein
MDFEAIHRWFLLQPFIIVGMAAILMTAAYLIDWIMEWITRDPSRLARGDDHPRSIAAGNASHGDD